MEITLRKIKNTQGIIKISVTRTDFQSSVDQKIKEYSKTANIKGFRQGRVPLGMVKKMYGNALIIDEINKSVSKKMDAFLKEGKTQFLGQPIPIKGDQNIDWENQDLFEFDYEIGFTEPFDVNIDKKVKLEKYFIDVNNEVIDETIENLQRQFGKVTNPEISSEKDLLLGRMTSKDGKIDREISIDLRDIEKEVLKKLVGIKNGVEVELDIKEIFKNNILQKNQLQLDDELKKLKTLTFILKSINHYTLATIDQAFFDKSFKDAKIKDEAEFRDRVKEIISHNYQGESERFFNQQVIEKFIGLIKIELPDAFLKKWLTQTNENITQALVESEYNQYAKELKWSLIRDHIVKNQKIEIGHNDVKNEAKKLIKNQITESADENQIDSMVDNYLQGKNGEIYMKIFNQIQSNKVLEYIKNKISIKEKTISLGKFREL